MYAVIKSGGKQYRVEEGEQLAVELLADAGEVELLPVLVVDVNTGKNVGRTNLEETVYRNNLEAAEEVARQLRLRDIGGIIVIDFIDMEIRKNRDSVVKALREALARDLSLIHI